MFFYSSPWIRWPGHVSNHLPPSVHIKNAVVPSPPICTGPTLPFYFQLTANISHDSSCNAPCSHNAAILLLLIIFYCTNETQTAYIMLQHDFHCSLNSLRHYVIVCQIYKHILTCKNTVITCQTVEFGRATTVLGITMLCKLLIGKTGC